MTEVISHKAYELLKTRYERVCLDYVILSYGEKYEGLKTHKEAVAEALCILCKRFESDDYSFSVQMDKMNAVKTDINELLEVPDDSSYDNKSKVNRGYNIPRPIPYWFAFLEPPHGTPYLKSDFIEFNNVLFENRDDTEVYRWNDDFSNYFDEGKEWWGTGMWTSCDKTAGIIVVIGASCTD